MNPAMKRQLERAQEVAANKRLRALLFGAAILTVTFIGTTYGGPCSRADDDPMRYECREYDIGDCEAEKPTSCQKANDGFLDITRPLQQDLPLNTGATLGLLLPVLMIAYELRKDAKRYRNANVGNHAFRASYSQTDGRIPVPGGQFELFLLGGTDDGVAPDEGVLCVYAGVMEERGIDVDCKVDPLRVPLERLPPAAADICRAEGLKGPFYLSVSYRERGVKDPTKVNDAILKALDVNLLANHQRVFHEEVLKLADDERDHNDAALEAAVRRVVYPQMGNGGGKP